MNDFTLSGPAWFDAVAEPVVLLRGGVVVYRNPAAADRGIEEGAPPPPELSGLSEPGLTALYWQGSAWNCRVMTNQEGLLLHLSPARGGDISMERLGQIASKLKKPLSNLLGAAQLLEKSGEELPQERREQYQAIQRKNYHVLLRMVENMELMSGLETAGFYPRVLDFGGLCSHVVRAVQSLGEQAGRAVELEIKDGNLLVLGEDAWLRKLIYHLISNGLRAAGLGGSVVLRLEKRGKWVRLTVVDSGSGFEAGELTRAFDPGTGTEAIVGDGAGLGFGISVCRLVAQRHGGRIALVSGNGGTAVVELPLCEGVDFAELHTSTDYSGGLNETFTQLADVLPWRCFTGE